MVSRSAGHNGGMSRPRSELHARLDALYEEYDHRFLDPDPLEPVRAQRTKADREVVGLLASGLAFGNVVSIKRSVAAVLEILGPRPARTVDTDAQIHHANPRLREYSTRRVPRTGDQQRATVV